MSTDRHQQEQTTASQVLELKKQIARAGHVLVEEYIDDGYSGTMLDRPSLEALRRDAKVDVFDTIYFLSADRIAREVAHQTIIVGELLKRKKQIVIGGKDYVHNPENKLTLTTLGARAAQQGPANATPVSASDGDPDRRLSTVKSHPGGCCLSLRLR